jgi:hypothetical protein
MRRYFDVRLYGTHKLICPSRYLSDIGPITLIAISSEWNYYLFATTWQSNRKAGMFMTVLSFRSSSIFLSDVFPNLSAPIREDSHIDGNLLHGVEAPRCCSRSSGHLL